MVLGYLQAEWKELHHAALIQVDEFAEFRGKDQRRGMTKIHKTKLAAGTNFAVKHRGDLLPAVCGAAAKCIASGGRLSQAQVQPFEHLRSGFSSVIEFSEHQSLEGVVDG